MSSPPMDLGPGWLRGPHYDLTLIGGVLLVALLSGLVVVANPGLFTIVLFVDLWLLGYHHVIATFTRLSFDRESLSRHRFLIFYLPPIVFAVTFALAWAVGIWAIASLYLYWQWFHYTRQSWGISQVYRRKSEGLVDEGPLFSKLSFYLLPAWGILHRSWQAPDTFLGIELHVIPVPGLLVDAVGAAALVSILAWGYGRIRAWRAGRLPLAHTCFMTSHYLVFLVGYGLIEDITHGWLVINVWHNAQYVLFVWLFNTNRFKNGRSEKARFLSRISQPDRKFLYFLYCIAISTVLYIAIMPLGKIAPLAGIPLLILIYQTINFHHYIVDSVIWKVRKKSIRTTMGLSGP